MFTMMEWDELIWSELTHCSALRAYDYALQICLHKSIAVAFTIKLINKHEINLATFCSGARNMNMSCWLAGPAVHQVVKAQPDASTMATMLSLLFVKLVSWALSALVARICRGHSQQHPQQRSQEQQQQLKQQTSDQTSPGSAHQHRSVRISGPHIICGMCDLKSTHHLCMMPINCLPAINNLAVLPCSCRCCAQHPVRSRRLPDNV